MVSEAILERPALFQDNKHPDTGEPLRAVRAVAVCVYVSLCVAVWLCGCGCVAVCTRACYSALSHSVNTPMQVDLAVEMADICVMLGHVEDCKALRHHCYYLLRAQFQVRAYSTASGCSTC